MSLGGLAAHLRWIPEWAGTILNEPSFDLAKTPPSAAEPASRDAILSAFDATRARTRAWMDKTHGGYNAVDPDACRAADLLGAARLGLPLLRAAHVIHHRGQLSVYLRLNGVPAAAIDGPSADEGS